MTAKQELLDDMLHRDKSGATLRIHDTLLEHGFKWKDRAQTMMYFARRNQGGELGLIAMRPGLVSFPRNFWASRATALNRAMRSFNVSSHIALDDGWFHSSQYSVGQVALAGHTEMAIIEVIRNIVVPEARAAGAHL
jgi:hypothetical protein